MQDLHILPKLRDSLSYLYLDQAIVQRQRHALEVIEENGKTLVPAANLSVLMLGPGTSITQAAIRLLAEHGCSVIWVGEDATRFYAAGTGETRKAYRLLKQAALVSDMHTRHTIVRRMYRFRFDEDLEPDLTLPQIRGLEGVRVRKAYAAASETYGVAWHGRRYDRQNWRGGDTINRALSAANALLNGLCHAAIISGGYSPALGFIHTGKQLSFVYDVADLYKSEVTIPVAFATVADGEDRVEARVRANCRERFRAVKLLQRILPDIDTLLDLEDEPDADPAGFDSDPALPADLWRPLHDPE